MSKLKDSILLLRSQNKTYNEIQAQLKCSKGTIAYYCGKGQKEKSLLRRNKHRQNQHPYTQRIESFKNHTKKKTNNTIKNRLPIRRLIQIKIQAFHYKYKEYGVYQQINFSVQDVIDKFGENPTCYLTGQTIDIYKPRTYQFDHIIPRSRGGDNSIDNLGICSQRANQSKRDMTPDEFINLCKQVLQHNGYQVIKSDDNGY